MNEVPSFQPNREDDTVFRADNRNTQTVDIPTVLRDAQGRVRWKLPENTPEENEQLGIRNVQGLFLEQFPEFNDLFPRGEDGRITGDKKEEAKKFIMGKIGRSKNFTIHIGSPPLNKRSTPYFEGSYFTAIRKSFSLWGIEFEEPTISGAKIHWLTAGITQEQLKERLELEAEVFLVENGNFSESALIGAGKGGFRKAIRKYYPGGLQGLKEHLGLSSDTLYSSYLQQPDALETTRQEALDFYQTEGNITYGLLIQRSKRALIAAIRKYPGGLGQLKMDLRLDEDRKSRGYWTLERIEAEASEFLRKNGKLARKLLSQEGRDDLRNAITTNYPGGWIKIRERLRVAQPQPKHLMGKSYWTSEKITEEALAFYQRHGHLSSSLLIQDGNSGLADAIKRYYPGGWKQLRTDVALESKSNRKPRWYWTPENTEREASEFFIKYGNISYGLLVEHGRNDLILAIYAKYPGGHTALKEKLGISSSPKEIISPDQANEELMKFLEVKEDE